MTNTSDPASAGASSTDGTGPIRVHARPTVPPSPLGQRIVETVRAADHIARVDLAKQLDVSPASITAAVTELMAQGLLTEEDRPLRQGQRGRPPTSLGLVPDAGYVVGLKLGEYRHSAVLMDFAGRSVAEHVIDRTAPSRDEGQLLSEVDALIDLVLEDTSVSRARILRMGAGLPGFIDHATGSSAWTPLLPDGHHSLADVLSQRLGSPVAIDNDANLLTLAELWFGRGRSVSDFAVMTIEQGIGMGLALNHQLYRGAHALGMELGHTKVQLDGALCRCGQRGCLEAYISDYALVREASTALDLSVRQAQSAHIVLDALHDQAKAGNEAARSIFRRAGRYMALGLANIVNLFDPALIIVSGARLRFDYLYADEVFAEMREMVIASGRPPPRIEVNAWGEYGWARGAAAMALNEATNALFVEAEA